ncbi:MAG: hypothetical protein O2923_14875 [Verrucomicrobia bacterium]|nr:hypothetical protein [Verrucomicrobiota bacterium]MDA1088636.1 hypothetical protein [Verrucomicrobiota bacterium]
MQGGDTLIIKDGTYSGSANKIWQWMYPPFGTANDYTVIEAENPGSVTFTTSAPLDMQNFPQNNAADPLRYIRFEGLKWVGSTTLFGAEFIKFVRCAFEGDMPDGNTWTFAMLYSKKVLMEDTVAFGKGRYKYLAYKSKKLIFRRAIARNDYANKNAPGSDPIAPFAIYYSTNVQVQNSMVIDSDAPQFWDPIPTEVAGAFYTPNGARDVKLRGCIALNNAMSGYTGVSSELLIDNSVFWGCISGPGTKFGASEIANHITVGGLVTPASMGMSVGQTNAAQFIPPGRGTESQQGGFDVGNSIIMDCFDLGIGSDSVGKNALWNNNNNGNTVASDVTLVNPEANSLKHLPRIEAGSALSGQASDGGDVGANVLKKIGVSGTIWGETGYDSVTSHDLWPWPNEEWVKAELGGYNAGGGDTSIPRGDRGFAAYVSPFGSPNTLSSYIWEYLGTKIPDGIYPTPDPDADTDGMDDAWEALYGGDLAPGDDDDGDGHTNIEEFQAGTDPTDPSDVLRIMDLTQSGQTRTFSYLSVDQKQYSLECLTGSLVNTNWSPIQSLTGDGGTQTMQHVVSPTVQAYYRLRVQ